MNRKFFLVAALGVLLLLSGCFLFEEKHDFAIENTLEIIDANKTFETPLEKVKDIKGPLSPTAFKNKPFSG